MQKSGNDMIKKTFYIRGMHCVACAMTIDGVLEDLPGVRSATTHYARQIVNVEYDDQKVTDDQIILAIHTSGYEAVANEPEQKM